MIFLECYNDEILVKSLGFTNKQISHQKCKGEVVKKVGKSSGAIGIIDEDKKANEPKEMKNYKEIIENKADRTVKLLQKKDDKNKKLVQISPYLEHWLLNRARRNKIKPADFSLPDDPKKLHAIPNLERNKNFQKFLDRLIETDVEIQTLKKWIEEVLWH
jgi:hypothetical protein